MNITDYLAKTEFATKQLFNSLEHYQTLLRESMPPTFSMHGDVSDEVFYERWQEWYEEHREEHNFANQRSNEYKALQFSNATICGSILQLAFMGISQTSRHDEETECLNGTRKKFGVGRSIRGIPLGLIIYAGRTQFNHWDDDTLNPPAKCIFDKIATGHGIEGVKDPSFDLDNRRFDIYSDQILALIGWKKYRQFKNDMLNMLITFEGEENV